MFFFNSRLLQFFMFCKMVNQTCEFAGLAFVKSHNKVVVALQIPLLHSFAAAVCFSLSHMIRGLIYFQSCETASDSRS